MCRYSFLTTLAGGHMFLLNTIPFVRSQVHFTLLFLFLCACSSQPRSSNSATQSTILTNQELTSSWTPEYSSLVGYWKLNGNNGSSIDDGAIILATIGANGVSTNSVVPPEVLAITPGQVGQAMQFDYAHQLNVNSAGSISGAFTVQTWVKFDSRNSMGHTLFSTKNTNDHGFDFQIQSDGTVHAEIGDGSNWLTTNADASDTFTAGAWHQVVYSVNQTGYSIYHNGALIGSGTFSNATPLLYDSTHQIVLGGNDYFGGALDEVAVWDVALSSTDVTALYTHGSAAMAIDVSWTPQFSEIKQYWSFDRTLGPLHYGDTITAMIGDHGTVGGSEPTIYINGIVGSGIQFDQNHVIAVTPTSTLSGTFSVQAWVKFDADSDYNGSIFGTRSPSDQSFDFKIDSNNNIHGDIGDGTNWLTNSADANESFPSGVWHQIVYTVTPTQYKIYHNGTMISSGALSGTPLLYDSTHQIGIGGDSADGGEAFGGKLDEVAIWGALLSDSDVATLYTQGSAGTAINVSWAPQYSSIQQYWALDGTLGTIQDGADISASIGDHGTIKNTSNANVSPKQALQYAAGKINQGIACHGTGDQINITPSGTVSGSFTVGLWINPTSSALGSGAMIGTNSNGNGFDLKINGDGTLHVDFGDGTGNSLSRDGLTVLTAGNWYYVSCTVSSSGYALYVNGELDTEGNNSNFQYNFLYDSDHPIAICNDTTTDSGGFPGIVNEVAIWNKTLSPNEVLQVFQGQ